MPHEGLRIRHLRRPEHIRLHTLRRKARADGGAQSGGPIGILKEQRPDHAPGLAPQRPAYTQVQHEPRLPAAHVQFRRPHDQPGRLRQPPFRAVPSGQPYQHRGKSYPAPPVVAVHVRLADARLLDKQLQVIAHQPEDRMPPHGRGKIHAPARSEQPGLPAHALFVVDGRFALADVADAPRDVPRGRERPAIPPHARVFKAFHPIKARPGHVHGEEFGQARQDAEREQERQPLGADFRPPGREYRKQRRIPARINVMAAAGQCSGGHPLPDGGSGPCAVDDKEALSAKTGERSFVKDIHGQEGTGKRFPRRLPPADEQPERRVFMQIAETFAPHPASTANHPDHTAVHTPLRAVSPEKGGLEGALSGRNVSSMAGTRK